MSAPRIMLEKLWASHEILRREEARMAEAV